MTCNTIPLATFTRLVDLYYYILALPSLIPSPSVNQAFSELVSLCLQIRIPSKHLLEHLQNVRSADDKSKFNVRSLIERAMEAEGCMERYWAKILAADADVDTAMRTFWYWDNYATLTRYELDSLAAAGCQCMGRVAFIGSGPLPLTSVLVGQETRGEVVLYDRDAEANVLAAAWVQKLSVPNTNGPVASYSFRDIDVWAEDHRAFARYDVVWVAAAVGGDGAEKRAIVDHLRRGMRKGTFLAVRSVEMGCSLLYPEIKRSEFANLDIVRHDIPPKGVVNSVMVLRV
ncbi:Nicotianamine synthase [Gautieria morchelliformis]|nr:Nicotianamine synthase [Gautieria morchelliformis]